MSLSVLHIVYKGIIVSDWCSWVSSTVAEQRSGLNILTDMISLNTWTSGGSVVLETLWGFTWATHQHDHLLTVKASRWMLSRYSLNHICYASTLTCVNTKSSWGWWWTCLVLQDSQFKISQRSFTGAGKKQEETQRLWRLLQSLTMRNPGGDRDKLGTNRNTKINAGQENWRKYIKYVQLMSEETDLD